MLTATAPIPVEMTNDNIMLIWRHLWGMRERLPNGEADDVHLLCAILKAPNTFVLEIGDMGGVLVFTDVQAPDDALPNREVTANGHVYIWDKKCLGQVDAIRNAGVQFMRDRRIDRVFAEIGHKGSEHARPLLEAIGFQRIGVLRRRKNPSSGETNPSTLYDFILPDTEG